MKKILIFILFASLSCGAKQVTAAEIEVPGLITDHTVTSVGHAFYRDFSDNWEKEYPGTLTISERPSARWGSWITIKIEQDTVYQTFLFPNKRSFDKDVAVAIESVNESLSRRTIDKALLNTGDLTADEF
ncbi:curli production assembly/transport protein CsgE [Hafnia alvei]|uniref:curli production assembly/transport protein CsgE n=1 Tax=Hafnia alvei TaxID=569 RepID=UPI0011EF8465|nr:curli production assembly/transport protein CsgE [Hafnia alvei]KAA0261067.1 curli production assembly/transport protein CsgE [Hafnia alvei]